MHEIREEIRADNLTALEQEWIRRDERGWHLGEVAFILGLLLVNVALVSSLTLLVEHWLLKR